MPNPLDDKALELLAGASQSDIWALSAGHMARAIGLEPDAWQLEFWAMNYRRALLLCSRRSGKTTAVAIKALHDAMYAPDRKPATVLIFAPAGKQSDELLHHLHEYYKRLGRPVPRQSDKIASLDFANGSRIIPLTSNPDSAVGYTPTTIIIDEAARVEDDLYKAIAPMRALGKCQLIALSTPHGKQGWFYNEWIGEGDWYRVRKTADDCPRIDKTVIEEDRASFGEPYVKQEYYCSFELMAGLVYPEFEQCVIDPIDIKKINVARVFGGIDFGWNNPSAVIVGILDNDDVLYLVEEIYGSRLTDEELAHQARALMEKYPIERFYCDSAAPQSIEKMRRADVPATEAMKKVPDGIRACGARMRTGRLKCFRTCKNLIREMGLYHYDPERTLQVDLPVKENDHLPDALRYMISRIDRVNAPKGIKPYVAPDMPAEESDLAAAGPEGGPTGDQVRYRKVTPQREADIITRPERPFFMEDEYGWH